LWLSLSNAIQKKYLTTAASFIEGNGLISGHGYIIKDFLLVEQKSKKIRLIKMKNPWKSIGDLKIKGLSHGEWTGAYSNNDKQSWT
jgi:hypothetical protein